MRESIVRIGLYCFPKQTQRPVFMLGGDKSCDERAGALVYLTGGRTPVVGKNSSVSARRDVDSHPIVGAAVGVIFADSLTQRSGIYPNGASIGVVTLLKNVEPDLMLGELHRIGLSFLIRQCCGDDVSKHLREPGRGRENIAFEHPAELRLYCLLGRRVLRCGSIRLEAIIPQCRH
jgi:hypothetical protein